MIGTARLALFGDIHANHRALAAVLAAVDGRGIDRGVCTGDLQPWSGAIACQNDCAGVPDLATYSTDPDAAMYKGDHVQCRLFHLSSAAVKDPEIHCPHVAGAPPCAPEG